MTSSSNHTSTSADYRQPTAQQQFARKQNLERAALQALAAGELETDELIAALKRTTPACARGLTPMTLSQGVLRGMKARGLLERPSDGSWARTKDGALAAGTLQASDTTAAPLPSADDAPAGFLGASMSRYVPLDLPPCAPRRGLGTGDMRPAVRRPGSGDALRLPSRINNALHWPDGSITRA